MMKGHWSRDEPSNPALPSRYLLIGGLRGRLGS
jgi:hypothetical protein